MTNLRRLLGQRATSFARHLAHQVAAAALVSCSVLPCQPGPALDATFALGAHSFQLIDGVETRSFAIVVGRTLQSWAKTDGPEECPPFGYLLHHGRAMSLSLPFRCRSATAVDVSLAAGGGRALVIYDTTGSPSGPRHLALVSISASARVSIVATSDSVFVSDAFPRRASFGRVDGRDIGIATLDVPARLLFLERRGARLVTTPVGLAQYDPVFFSNTAANGSAFGLAYVRGDDGGSCVLLRVTGLEATNASVADRLGLPERLCSALSMRKTQRHAWILAETFGPHGVVATLATTNAEGRLIARDTLAFDATAASMAPVAHGVIVAGFRQASPGATVIRLVYLDSDGRRCETERRGPPLATSLVFLRGPVPRLAWFDFDTTGTFSGLLRTRSVRPCGLPQRRAGE